MKISDEQKKKYIARRENDVKECLEALSKKDNQVLQRVGHQLRGNALTFGFAPLGEIGERLESASVELNWQKMEEAVQQIQTYLAKLA